jgi:N-methylhydantoinase A
MRIKGQSHDLMVPVERPPKSSAELREWFDAAYTARYAYSPAAAALEMVNIRVTALGPMPDIELSARSKADGSNPKRSSRRIYGAGGWVEAAVIDRASLGRGDSLSGPAVVNESGSTTVVGAGWKIRVDDMGNLILDRDGDG